LLINNNKKAHKFKNKTSELNSPPSWIMKSQQIRRDNAFPFDRDPCDELPQAFVKRLSDRAREVINLRLFDAEKQAREQRGNRGRSATDMLWVREIQRGT
jgi:hypothetical protein